MALDGIAVSCITSEAEEKFLGARVDKIYQPNNDEIILSLRGKNENYKLLLSSNPNNPRLHITTVQRNNPMTAPLFCMVLRKHLSGGRILSVNQPEFERIIEIGIESLDEMGDKSEKKLILEIMGKHSNIILVDEKGKILDSIKRVSFDKSSVREVLPGRDYFYPPSQNKINPLTLDRQIFFAEAEAKKNFKVQEFIYKTYTGISPLSASEICHRAKVSPFDFVLTLSNDDLNRIFDSFYNIILDIKNKNFEPEIIYEPETRKIVDFSAFELKMFDSYIKKQYTSISKLLEDFYFERDNAYHISQKAHDMHMVVSRNIERCVKKKNIQLNTLKDLSDMDKLRLKGELITANIYAIKKGDKKLKTVNFYDENMSEIEIELDENKTPSENAQKYFSKYNKAKRTIEALEVQKKINDEELLYLENTLVDIENSTNESDLNEIRDELSEFGYMKRKAVKKGLTKKLQKSKPLNFVSSDGYDILVGKSNVQNDELTLKIAEKTDIWLHTKNIPGSHVIIRANGEPEKVPDTTLLEALNMSVFYSKAKNSSGVPVDTTLCKNVKKPKGAKPGLVIYEKNKTYYITPDLKIINTLKESLKE